MHITITAGSFFKGVLVLVGFYALFLLSDVALILLTAVVIASAVEPAALWLTKRGIPRTLSAIVVYLSVIGTLVVTFYFFVPALLKETSAFFHSFPSYVESVELWNPFRPSFLENGSTGISLNTALSNLRSYTEQVSGGFLKVATTIFGGILGLVLMIVLSFYLSVQEKGIENFLKIITPLKNQKYIVHLWRRSQRKIGLWMQGQILLAFFIAILVYLGLALLGVPNALLLAILAGMFEIIPVFGPILAAVPAIVLGFSESTSLGLMVMGFYIIIQQFENHLIYPLVVQKVVGMSPIIVILSLIVGGKIAGVLGVLLSVPVAAVVMEFLSDIAREKRIYESEEETI